ncbi:MAG TPA: 7-cyano-7-deazaguanine synthase QueC [Pyrinomonadaceae bacterium]|nr:7-cyano-7-deazaguanine synthase QueC [Pyrinomonadaceae bacterium]
MAKHKLSVVLLSGGMDSCVTAAIAKAESEDIAVLHASYGQRTEKRELKSFNDIADFYNVERRLIVKVPHFSNVGGSSLTDEKIEVSEADLSTKEIPTSYVPFRNAVLLSIAVGWAEILHSEAVYIGAVFEDSSGYPDCRPEFYEAFQKAVTLGTKPETLIRIITPVINLKKNEIISRGTELRAPLHLTWSCYKSETLACGKCDSCALRLRAFKRAGIEDPIPYAARPDYE